MDHPMTSTTARDSDKATQNAQGFSRGSAQMPSAFSRGEWDYQYDADADVLEGRRSGHGPADTFFCPAFPEFAVRLDRKTGELTGVDLYDFRATVVVRDPTLGRSWAELEAAKRTLADHRKRPAWFRRPQIGRRVEPSELGERISNLCLA
jgi:hypothetical protein